MNQYSDTSVRIWSGLTRLVPLPKLLNSSFHASCPTGESEMPTATVCGRVELMARAVVSRLLHEPTLRLKESEGDRAYVYVDALRELFALEGATAPEVQAEVTSLEARRKKSRSA